jgi:opacity protein-like surface antigen
MRLVAAIACVASFVSVEAVLAQESAPPPAVAVPPEAAPPAPVAPAPTVVAPPRATSQVYLGVRAGMYDPSTDDADDIMSVFDQGIDLEGIVGFPLSPYLALEGAIGYYASGTDTMTAYDPDFGTISAKMDLSVIPITASLRGTAHAGPVALSALAGVGLHMASLEMTANVPGLFSGSASDDDNAFGFHVGAGVAVALGERVSLGAELRRTFVSATLADEDFELGGLRIGGMLTFRP